MPSAAWSGPDPEEHDNHRAAGQADQDVAAHARVEDLALHQRVQPSRLSAIPPHGGLDRQVHHVEQAPGKQRLAHRLEEAVELELRVAAVRVVEHPRDELADGSNRDQSQPPR